jgi:aldehyde dehydrogenase family protein
MLIVSHSFVIVTYAGNAVVPVARIIAKAAAEHLTPVTLELGRKSPVTIDPDTMNLGITAKRVLCSKTLNAGQVRSENTTRLRTTIFSTRTKRLPLHRFGWFQITSLSRARFKMTL